MWSIYKHTCKTTGKSYIGQTIGTLDYRAKWKGSGYRKSPKFYAAIQKYGWNDFTHEILETNIDSEAKANEREQYWISYYDTLKNGYNILPGGQIDNTDLFKKIYQIDKNKNIIAKFKSAADATRELFPEKPYWYANEILKCCRNIRSNADGLYFCFVDEYDQYQPQKVKNSFNAIMQLDKNKAIINKFNTFAEANRATGISIPHIWACCNGERKTAGDYYWCFELDYDKYQIPEVDDWPEPKAVVQVDKKTNKIIKQFPSANIASKETGVSQGNISSACRGEIPSAGGYIWKFNEDCLTNKEIKKPMEKESVKVFDLQAAFKALDEIEAPKTKEGLRANRVNLKETFATKTYGDSLVEDYYSVMDHEALEEAQEDREDEIAKAKLARIEKIVDLDAESPEDLEPSYVGKVIIQCPQCMTLFYKKPEDVEPSEDNPEMVNVNEVCQHCGNDTGYMLIGKVGEIEPEEAAHFEPEGENELDIDFSEPTEEVSPEGTGGGFEDVFTEDSESSEEDLDLSLGEVELTPEEEVKESLTEAKEDSDSEDIDEKEVTVTISEIKDVAEDAGKAVVKAEVEEKEEVKEVTDKVVEKEVAKEVLTEAEVPVRKFAIIDWSKSLYGNEIKYEELKARLKKEYPNVMFMFYHPIKLESALKYASMNVPFIFITDRDVSSDKDGTQILKHPKCERVIRLDLGEDLEERHVCEKCGKEICECDKVAAEKELKEETITEDPQTPDEIERILWRVADSFAESLEEAVEEPVQEETSAEEVAPVAETVGSFLDELKDYDGELPLEWKPIVIDEKEYPITAIGFDNSEEGKIIAEVSYALPEEPTINDEEAATEESAESEPEIPAEEAGDALDAYRKQKNESLKENGVSNTEFKGMLNSEVWKDFDESLTEDMETVKAKLSVYCDELEHAGEAAAKAMGADVETKEKEPAVEESLMEGQVELDEIPWWVHPIAKKEVEEDYTGTPEERTTHLEYIDPDPTDEKAVLPDNITKKEDDHCEKNPVINHDPDDKDVLKEEITDISEEYFDRHITEYLTEVYSNIKDYKSTNCKLKDGTLFIEGIITFNSGRTKNTVFEFISPVKDETGSLICEGYNKSLTEEKAFILKGVIEGGNKFVTESLAYSYQINGAKIEGSN